MKTANSLFNMSSMLNESAFDEDVDEVDDDDEDDDDDFLKLNQTDLSRLLPPYRKGQSQVNCVMAISLVQRWILPWDYFQPSKSNVSAYCSV